MIATRPMPVRRSWKRTFAWLLVALFLLAATVVTIVTASYIYALLFGFFAVATGIMVVSGSFTSNCPVCEAELRGLIGLRRCPQCLTYGKLDGGSYYELEPDYIEKSPMLAVPLKGGRIMPSLCCVCGAPSSRSEKMRIIRVGFAFDLDVPYCGQHSASANLDGEPAGKKTENPVLKVKSHAFYRACIAANYPHLARR